MMDSFIGNEQLFVDWGKGKDQLMIPEKAWYFYLGLRPVKIISLILSCHFFRRGKNRTPEKNHLTTHLQAEPGLSQMTWVRLEPTAGLEQHCTIFLPL